MSAQKISSCRNDAGFEGDFVAKPLEACDVVAGEALRLEMIEEIAA